MKSRPKQESGVIMAKEVDTRYETGISENNLRHWGMLEVLKEFLQNAVYAKTILKNEIKISYENGYAIISNSPSGFSKGKLLIGESEQADVAGAPGQYGEGMKAAMAVAVRCGKDVEILTNGFSVTPMLEPSSIDPEVKSLVFYISDNDLNNGTVFSVECDEKTLEEAKTYFAVLDGVDPQLVSGDNILDDYENCVYINGVLVSEMSTVFGYNFTNPDLMNRDRTSINTEKLKTEVRLMLLRLKSSSRIEEILKKVVEDNNSVESQLYMDFYDPETAGGSIVAWKMAASLVFGSKVAMASGTDSDTKARYHKFKLLTNVPSGWRWFFSNVLGIKPSNQLEELIDRPKNKHVKPVAEENGNLGWAKRIVKMYYGDYGTVRVSEEVVDQFGNPCKGLYERKTDITWLKRELLSSREETFKTLLHETIHRVSGAEDNTAYFTQQWEQACWNIFNRKIME